MKRSIIAVVAAASLISLSACSGSNPAPSNGGTASFAINSDPGNINPITNATDAGNQVDAFAYESLINFPPGKTPDGLLAKSWKEGTTKISFTLKSGIMCSDGSKLTATDVKKTFEYAGEEKTGSPYRGVYFPATGLSIAADDSARTVTFTTQTPQSFLLQTIGSLPIVCAAGLANPSQLNTKTFGTGPYTLKSSSPGQSYTFALRNDYTWGPNGVTSKTKGLPATVNVKVVATDATRANLLQSDELNFGIVGGADRDRLDSGDFTKLSAPLRPGLLFYNQSPKRVFNSLAVRQGVAEALDRSAIGKVATSGRGEAMKALVSTFSSVCSNSDSTSSIPKFDIVKANATLEAAGWVKGSDGIRQKHGQKLSIKVLFPSAESAGVTAAIELIQQELLKVGVDAVPTPSSSYTDVIFQGGDWDMVYAPIYTSLPSDWQGILSGEFPPNGGNWTYNTNKTYFSLAAQAQEKAGEASCPLWTKAQDSLFSNLEVTPLSAATSTYYGSGLKYGLSKTTVMPTTLRLTK